MNFMQRMHRLIETIIRETGEMSVTEMTVESKMFDCMFDYTTKNHLFLRAEEDTIPFDTMTVNFLGRPVVIKRQKRVEQG